MDAVLLLKAAAMGDTDYMAGLPTYCFWCKDPEGWTPLHYSAGNGMLASCRFLVERIGVSIDTKSTKGVTPLLLAASRGHMIIAHYLIHKGAETKIADFEGVTLLHYAARTGDKDLMEMLLWRGVDINSAAVSGTALQWATQSGNSKIVKFLLEQGAKVEPCNIYSHSPLVWAVHSQSSVCLDLLLKAGADINAVSFSCGKTPLAYAALNAANKNFLNVLLDLGANPNIVTFDQLKPIELAADNLDAVSVLLPFTDEIPECPIWNTDGIVKYYQSEEALREKRAKYALALRSFKKDAKEALLRSDYPVAVALYSVVICLDPTKTRYLLKRSKCWAYMGRGFYALFDATSCLHTQPGWAKAHYRVGVAWTVLKNRCMAIRSFVDALKLDPKNLQCQVALRQCVTDFADSLLTKAALKPRKNRCMAIRSFVDALKLDPENLQCQVALRQCATDVADSLLTKTALKPPRPPFH